MSLDTALGAAYHRSVAGDRAGALALLRDPVAADREGAAARQAGLKTIVAARTQGQRCHAHIEKIQCDLLAAALQEASDA